ncbi:site-specific DNA-methyltransferase [Nonomuraea sp. NPDC049486]|uniref:DNA-methyltransferase n=1 Tax=Nonomuraea sp. NPDC049486 TaxID=3155773 RepID=UPI0034437EC7
MGQIEGTDGAYANDVPEYEQLVPTGPIPPGRASIMNGRLKDTPANRALNPDVASAEVFTSDLLTKGAYYADDRSIIIHDEVRTGLQKLIDAGIKVNCIVTSPPYYGQRDYEVPGQFGQEEHPQHFIDNLVEIFQLCWQVLSDEGSLWINIGDTYWSGKGAHKSGEAKQKARRFGIRPQDRPGDGLWARPKQLLLIPHRLTIALQERGWLVRNDNVWIKPNPVPDQVRDRCSISHEYVFHLTKSRWYYFDRTPVGRITVTKKGETKILPPLDTWSLPTSKRNGSRHRATFSEELVRIPILGSTPPDGIVLDPFNGSGTSTYVAKKFGFRSIGIDLNEEYSEEAASRLKELDGQLALGEDLE